VEWLTAGEADVGMWKGVTEESGRAAALAAWKAMAIARLLVCMPVTKLEWSGLGMSDALPVKLCQLEALEELWLCAMVALDVPEGLHELTERLRSGWKVGLAFYDGSENQFY